jgi:signal transduction histidine kinase
VVGGYLRMLQRDETPLAPRHRQLVDHAARSCERLVELISEMSDLAKLDNQTANLHFETFDLFSELASVAGHVEEGRDRDVTLQVTGPSHGARVTADRRRVGAALQALLRAVLREQGMPVVIQADRRLVREETGTAAVVVIAREADVERALHSPPQRFDQRRGGMGLSLPIAKRVIERARGRLWSPSSNESDDRAFRNAVLLSIPTVA